MAAFNTRIQHKCDIEANWNKASFVPYKGELIIYSPDENYSYPRFKIGDGTSTIGALPFAGSQVQIIAWEDDD